MNKLLKGLILLSPVFGLHTVGAAQGGSEGKMSSGSPKMKSTEIEAETLIDVYGGYRRDVLKSRIATMGPGHTEGELDILKASALSIWEVGLDAQLAINAHWFIGGFYSHGWITSGKYKEFINSPPGAPASLVTKGHQKGHTNDARVGLGFLSHVRDGFGIAPSFGWGFNQQVTLLKDANNDQFEDLKFSSIWNGPFGAVDFIYRNTDYNFSIQGGYEFHLTDWRGGYILKNEPVLDGFGNIVTFTDHRKASTAFGHVVRLDGRWDFIENWFLDIGLKYQNFSTRGTGEVFDSIQDFPIVLENFPTPGADLPLTEVEFHKQTKWHSFGGMLRIGYNY